MAGRVTELALGGLGLAGTLPGQLAALGSLALLDLGGNAFQGSLPPGWLEDGGFPSLVSADLGGNKLQGGQAGGDAGQAGGDARLACYAARVGRTAPVPGDPLPQSCHPAGMHHPDALPADATLFAALRCAAPAGTLPPDWSSTTLAALDLSDNQLTAGLPPSWGGGPLPALSQLALFGNSLQGAALPRAAHRTQPAPGIRTLRAGLWGA